ncbi:MAG: flagellar hook-length control protein FliK [Firmicutes bacterium]|nr:flagellar hook-length control protein FliK [Bacillota bacterium]
MRTAATTRSTSNAQSAGTSQMGGGYAYNTNNFYAFPPGTRFKALILDIQPGKITIKLNDESSFTARTMVLPDARIGEESYFLVKSNNLDGLIQLEMLRSSPQHSQDKLVKEMLQKSGIIAADQNMDIGRAILNDNLPLDETTLQKAMFFQHQNAATLQKTLFLMQNEFPENENSIKMLNGVLSQHLTQMLTNAKNADYLSDLLNLSSLQNLTQKSLQQYYKNLVANPKISFQVLQNLAFMAFMEQQSQKNGKIAYYQIPFAFKKQPGQAELFIFGNKKNQAKSNEQSTAIIALDTQNIGRVEILTTKTNRNVKFNFACEEKTINLIQAKSPQLTANLAKKGFAVTEISYKSAESPTNLLNCEKADDSQQATNSNKRYTFDMRV